MILIFLNLVFVFQAQAQVCPPERDCGEGCCLGNQICQYINGNSTCVTKPHKCQDYLGACGHQLCCGSEELCNIIPSNPPTYYCDSKYNCPYSRGCMKTCCRQDEICAAYPSETIDHPLRFLCQPKLTKCSINYMQNCQENEECVVNVYTKEPWYSEGVCVEIPEDTEFCVANEMCRPNQLCSRNYSPFAMDPWHFPGICVDTPVGYHQEKYCHRDEGCKDGQYCHKEDFERHPRLQTDFPPRQPPGLGICKPKQPEPPNCPWHRSCDGDCCEEDEVCHFQYVDPQHRYVCTKPNIRKCSIDYEQNCIFGEECAVDVLDKEPWYSLGVCVTLPPKDKIRFCIRNSMCASNELCTRNYGPFVMDPWHQPGMCAPNPRKT